jgi:hypothetical protein
VAAGCRGIFLVKQPAYMNFLWALVRPFMKQKLRERVHFIGQDLAAFAQFIDPAVGGAGWGGVGLGAAAAAAAAGFPLLAGGHRSSHCRA